MELLGGVEVADDHGYGVLEPGSLIEISYEIANVGHMNTPEAQDVIVTVLSTDDLKPLVNSDMHHQGFVTLPRCIPPHSRAKLPEPISSILTDLQRPTVGKLLFLCTSLRHRSAVTRVNRAFPLVEKQYTIIKMSCALELSRMCGVVSVLPGGEALFFVDVRNMANIPIGFDADIVRPAKVV